MYMVPVPLKYGKTRSTQNIRGYFYSLYCASIMPRCITNILLNAKMQFRQGNRRHQISP